MKNIDNQRSAKKNSVFLTAGWLFADLFLALSVIFLVSNSKIPSSEYLLSVSKSATLDVPQNSPMPDEEIITPTLTARPDENLQVGLDTTPVILIVNVTPVKYLSNDASETENIQVSLKNKLSDYLDRRAGLVITLGYHNEIGIGMRLAQKGNLELKKLYPELFRNSVMKSFWFSTDVINVAGTIKFEIYFLTKVDP